MLEGEKSLQLSGWASSGYISIFNNSRTCPLSPQLRKREREKKNVRFLLCHQLLLWYCGVCAYPKPRFFSFMCTCSGALHLQRRGKRRLFLEKLRSGIFFFFFSFLSSFIFIFILFPNQKYYFLLFCFYPLLTSGLYRIFCPHSPTPSSYSSFFLVKTPEILPYFWKNKAEIFYHIWLSLLLLENLTRTPWNCMTRQQSPILHIFKYFWFQLNWLDPHQYLSRSIKPPSNWFKKKKTATYIFVAVLFIYL